LSGGQPHDGEIDTANVNSLDQTKAGLTPANPANDVCTLGFYIDWTARGSSEVNDELLLLVLRRVISLFDCGQYEVRKQKVPD
jgi:hypothetical protein